MEKTSKKRLISELEQQECAALNAIYKAKKRVLGVTQEQIAIEGLRASTQSAASHYLTGKNALNVEAAAVFARYLQEPIESFSPRLAAEIARMASSTSEQSYQKDDKYQSATPEHRQAVDELVDKLLDLSPEQALKVKQAMELLMPSDDRTKN